ncbi:hypothetical protein QUF75_14640 [Desulfococcaceae bacterium HSG7]|nr:hypothetical protein [Desulfococcaceae bacterium HSG7]
MLKSIIIVNFDGQGIQVFIIGYRHFTHIIKEECKLQSALPVTQTEVSTPDG